MNHENRSTKCRVESVTEGMNDIALYNIDFVNKISVTILIYDHEIYKRQFVNKFEHQFYKLREIHTNLNFEESERIYSQKAMTS